MCVLVMGVCVWGVCGGVHYLCAFLKVNRYEGFVHLVHIVHLPVSKLRLFSYHFNHRETILVDGLG